MAAPTVSELANWDGRQRQNAGSRRSSATVAREPPLENQAVDLFQPKGKISDQKRAEKSAFRSKLERDSLANSPANARPSSRVQDTTSTSSHHSHQPSVTRAPPNPALHSPSVVTSSKSSHLISNSSVHDSRVHNSRSTLSRERKSLPPLRPASTKESDVIDLTLEDTEDELSVNDVLVVDSTNFNDQHHDPGPSRRTLSSSHSSPIALEQSLFTPPPPSRRCPRWVLDHLEVPSFPKGLTKADYQPFLSVVPLPGSTTHGDSPLAEPPVTKKCTPYGALTTVDHSGVPLPAPTTAATFGDISAAEVPPKKRKGKERERDQGSPRKKCKQHFPANGPDMVSNGSLDAFHEHVTIPIYDDDTYPPLTALDLVSNTRFQFAHAWREHSSKLREAKLDWMFKFDLLGRTCIWASSVDTPSPRLPGTAGYVSVERARPWELAPPKGLAQVESTGDVLDEQAHATGNHDVVQTDPPLPDDALSDPSASLDAPLSSTTASQGLAVVDTEHDIHQYFNGLGDSPARHVRPLEKLAATHIFRPHLLPSAGHAPTDPLDLEFPSLELDPRVADTSSHECFLGVPPSPPPEDIESAAPPEPIPDSPLQPANYFPGSPSNIFEAPPHGAWSFKQGEVVVPSDEPSPVNDVAPIAPGTIDPSLLGLEQSQPPKPSQPPKSATSKRRSKLPEPVIYIRRPVDSSSLPLLSGKRPVQIKYRDSVDSPAPPPSQIGPKETPLDPAETSNQTKSDTDDHSRLKRRSVPSRKLREYHTATESDSDYIPESSTSKIKLKLKLKRSSHRDKESVDEHQDVVAETAPTMSFCHQCRNKSMRPKMLCSNVINGRVCGKRFCSRCILYRYPDITFDEHSAGFLCPACTNTCNCSFCSRNRGEEFISMRLGGLATSLLKTKVTLVRDVDQPLHHTQSPPGNTDVRRSTSARMTRTPEPSAIPVQSQFWAHVYGLEGERMGSAFMTREHVERLQTRRPSPPPLPKQAPTKPRKSKKRDKKQEKPKGPRVFVGRPLDAWNVLAVRDLEPSVDVEVQGKGKGKQRETSSGTSDRRRRCYIGTRAPLYEPYGRMPGTANPTPPPSSRYSTPALDSDGSLTPLSEFEVEAKGDDWPQPEVGESCSWAPPPSPGSNVHSSLSGPSSHSSSFAKKLPGGAPDVSMDGVRVQDQGLGPGHGGLVSGADVYVDVDMKTDGGDERASASTTLSEQDLARAISAALAAVSVASAC